MMFETWEVSYCLRMELGFRENFSGKHTIVWEQKHRPWGRDTAQQEG